VKMLTVALIWPSISLNDSSEEQRVKNGIINTQPVRSLRRLVLVMCALIWSDRLLWIILG